MNNKGFAITTILYGTLILFMLLLVSMLGILSTYKDRLSMLIDSNRGARDIINYVDIGYFDFNNVPDNKANKMKYTIDGEKITVTANVNDGYGFLPYYVELQAGKTYVFDCVTNGMWYSSSNSDDVEAWLMLDGNNTNNSDVTVHLKKNEYYYFKAPATGKYWLRLDVNTAGKTYYFDNIRVLGKVK